MAGWMAWLGEVLLGWSPEPPVVTVREQPLWRLQNVTFTLQQPKPLVRPKKRLRTLLKDSVPPPLSQPTVAPWLAYHDWVLEHRGDDEWLVAKVKRIAAGLSVQPQLRLTWNGFVVTVSGRDGPNSGSLGTGQFKTLLEYVHRLRVSGFAGKRIRWLSRKYVQRYRFRGYDAADVIASPGGSNLAELLPQLAWEYYLRVAREATGTSLAKLGWTP